MLSLGTDYFNRLQNIIYKVNSQYSALLNARSCNIGKFVKIDMAKKSGIEI